MGPAPRVQSSARRLTLQPAPGVPTTDQFDTRLAGHSSIASRSSWMGSASALRRLISCSQLSPKSYVQRSRSLGSASSWTSVAARLSRCPSSGSGGPYSPRSHETTCRWVSVPSLPGSLRGSDRVGSRSVQHLPPDRRLRDADQHDLHLQGRAAFLPPVTCSVPTVQVIGGRADLLRTCAGATIRNRSPGSHTDRCLR